MAPSLPSQVEVNGLLLGPGTPYVINAFNPFLLSARHTTTDRSWGPGSWSGREDAEAVAIPLRLSIDASNDTTWWSALRDLRAAMQPSSVDVEVRWMLGAEEFLMFARPRLVDPDTEGVVKGKAPVSCALMALDPHIYGATLHTQVLGLPSTTGGLTVPVTVPFTIGAVTTSGRALVVNAGTEETALRLRVDANGSTLVQPRVTVSSVSGVDVLRANLTLEAGQWLDIDTGARTAYLNGTSSRRGYMSGDWPLLPPGSAELAFDAATYSAAAQLTATWRDTWI